MLPDTLQVGLKEWAVTVRALDRGTQILLLRKGGIREEKKHFEVRYPDFLLYPSYEHQRQDLLKPESHADLEETLEGWEGDATVTFTHWARVQEVMEVLEQEKVDALSPLHIWTNDYARYRLHWKPRFPLHILLLRVFRLDQPKTLPVADYYAGCKSWVDLEEAVPLGVSHPVLDEVSFLQRVEAVHERLGSVDSVPVTPRS